jgi:Flp pilus assembly protein TadD
MAITDQLIMSVMSHLRAGKRQEAGKLCRDVLRVEPEHARAHCLLGIIAFQDGDAAEALALLQRAGELNDQLPDVPRAQAEVYLGIGQIDKALEAQRRATAMNPREPMGHLQEAILLQRLERSEEAEVAAQRALTLKPDMPGARQLLATLLYRRGEIAEAAELLLAVRSAPRPAADPNHHLALVLLALGRLGELDGLPAATAPNQVFGETVTGAIAAWLAGDVAACRALRERARPLAGEGYADAPNRSVFLTYLGILEGLLAWREANPAAYAGEAESTIHVMGDSHVLSYSGLVLDTLGEKRRLQSHLAFGCKAWHLVREEPSPYRAFFEATAVAIPEGATVLGVFGELDCRYKEGLMRVLRRNPLADWRAMTDDLVARYVAFMADTAQARGWTLWLASPPMTNVNTTLIGGGEREAFLGIIARFNERLAAEAAARGLPLVDVHAVTRDEDGNALRRHFIDTNHVRPAVLLEALAALRATGS